MNSTVRGLQIYSIPGANASQIWTILKGIFQWSTYFPNASFAILHISLALCVYCRYKYVVI